MSHIVSEDGQWQWNGRRWKKVTPDSWGEDQIEYINEHNSLYEDPPDTLDPEQIELDEIELNTAEDTPLLEGTAETAFSSVPALAEAGGISGTAAASVPSVGTAITALGIGGTIIGGGTLATVLSGSSDTTDHQDPIVSLPDHRYIGPGNTVDDTVPVDSDDTIAREHDIAYEHSKTQQDVQEADRHAASEFLTDVIENNNLHSVAGYIGLKTKEKVESALGVQYPPNLPTSSVSGMSPRREIRAIGKYPIDKDPREHPDFPKRSDYSAAHYQSRVRYIWDAWNRARQNHRYPRVDPPARLGINTTNRPPVDRRTGNRPSNASISFSEFKRRRAGRSGPLIDGFNRQREQQNNRNDHFLNTIVANDLGEDEAMEVENIIRQVDAGGISLADFDDADGAGPSNAPTVPPMASRGNKRGHGGPQGGPSAPPNPAVAAASSTSAGAAGSSSSDGGFDSSQGPVHSLMKGGYQATPGKLTFTKVHRMKSWALPYWKISSNGDYSGSNLVSTPLVKIPWEYMAYYMSPEEFDLIPSGSYVDSVHIEVMQTVASTAYPVGATEATVATTNHPKVLIIGKDLEKTMRGGINRVLTKTSNMIPSLGTNGTLTNWIKDFTTQQYGSIQSDADTIFTVPGCAHKIPYWNYLHFLIYQPSRAQAKARGFFTESTATPPVITADYSCGFEYFQNAITEVNSNDTTWDYVDTMHYKFESAPIGEQFRHQEILTENIKHNTGNAAYYNATRSVTNVTNQGNVTFTEAIRPSTRNTYPKVTYNSAPIEQGAYFVRGDAAGKPSRQPSYHIGMRAIDKMDPTDTSSRSTTFVEAFIEFEIKATCYVTLPSYPNRFTRPKNYTTNIENAVMGVGAYPGYGTNNSYVTFGLPNEISTAPTLSEVDQVDEDNGISRPRRSIPTLSHMTLRSKKRK